MGIHKRVSYWSVEIGNLDHELLVFWFRWTKQDWLIYFLLLLLGVCWGGRLASSDNLRVALSTSYHLCETHLVGKWPWKKVRWLEKKSTMAQVINKLVYEHFVCATRSVICIMIECLHFFNFFFKLILLIW